MYYLKIDVYEKMMWFSSGDTKSVTHTDDYENILCVFSGIKEVILVDYYKYKNLVNVSCLFKVEIKINLSFLF